MDLKVFQALATASKRAYASLRQVYFEERNRLEVSPILITFLSLGLGGILKSTTGAGSPIIAVPSLSILFDVPTAIAIFCYQTC